MTDCRRLNVFCANRVCLLQHPLYTFAATYLHTIQDSRKFVSNSNLNKPPTNPLPQTPSAASGRYKPGGLELAAAASTAPAAASSPPAYTAPAQHNPNPYQHEGKNIYGRAIRVFSGPVLRSANMFFQHSAVLTASLSTLLGQLSPVNLHAVTTTATTVFGACKRTRPQGCSFRNTLPLQGWPSTDSRQFRHLLPHMTTNTLTLIWMRIRRLTYILDLLPPPCLEDPHIFPL